MTAPDLVRTVRDVLAKATPGPWSKSPSKSLDPQYRHDWAICAGEYVPGVSLGMIGEVWAERQRGSPDADAALADAELIAHAPEWLEALAARVEALERAAREVIANPGCGDPDCCASAIAAEDARQKLRVLVPDA